MLKKVTSSAMVCALALNLSGCETLPESPFTKEQIGSVLGAAVGLVAASELCDGDNKELCYLASTALTTYVGNRIGKHLDEQEKLEMAQATRQSLVSGQTQSWSNAENNISGSVKVVESATVEAPVKVKVLKEKVKEVPPLDIMGETFQVNNDINVRGGPSTDYQVVGSLKGDEVINVVGKVQGTNWYLISQDSVGSGFVRSDLVRPAPEAVLLASDKVYADDELAETQISDTQLCRTVEQSVTLADGSVASDSVQACQGANGWVVKA